LEKIPEKGDLDFSTIGREDRLHNDLISLHMIKRFQPFLFSISLWVGLTCYPLVPRRAVQVDLSNPNSEERKGTKMGHVVMFAISLRNCGFGLGPFDWK